MFDKTTVYQLPGSSLTVEVLDEDIDDQTRRLVTIKKGERSIAMVEAEAEDVLAVFQDIFKKEA